MNSNKIESVAQCVEQFNRALIARDAETLTSLSSEGLSYGHSKGKVESRETFVGNVISDGATRFVKISVEAQTVEIVNDNAIVRHTFKADTSKNGTAGKLEVRNLLVWQHLGGHWRLIARQAFSVS